MSLDNFLKGEGKLQPQARHRCMICSKPALKKEVAQYVDGVKKGTITHTQHFIWLNYFAPTWGIKSQSTLRNHIKLCLGITL